MKLGARRGFTLLELVISVALFLVAITIALYATVGTNGLLSRTDSRSLVSEGSRTVTDTLRRTVNNVAVGGVEILQATAQSTNYVGVRVKTFSSDQKQKVCEVVGRANVNKTGGEEQYTLSDTGTTVAVWVFPLSDTNLCPAMTSSTIYQNRLLDSAVVPTSLTFALADFNCQTGCIETQELRYHLRVETKTAISGQGTIKKPSVELVSGLPIGLVGAISTGGSASNLVINTTSLPNGTTGTAYSQTLTASGGSTPYSWSVVAGGLPTGLLLNAGSGTISGTPSVAGTFNFTARVTDNSTTTADQALSIIIVGPLTITTASLPNGTVGTAYSQTLAASGGTTPYSWSLLSGALPNGLSLNSGTGAITGTPTTSGIFSFTAKVTDAASATATKALSITINSATPLTITTASVPNAVVNTAYSTTLAASGGTTPYTWAFSGPKPIQLSWLSLSTSGTLSGTPSSTGGPYSFTVQVTDAASTSTTKTFSITITAGSTLTITTSVLPAGMTNNPYSATLAASGGTTPYTWSLNTGSTPLPPGLTLSSAGVISGTPTTAGTYSFTVKVTDAALATATKSLSISISGGVVIGPGPV